MRFGESEATQFMMYPQLHVCCSLMILLRSGAAVLEMEHDVITLKTWLPLGADHNCLIRTCSSVFYLI